MPRIVEDQQAMNRNCRIDLQLRATAADSMVAMVVAI